ncbi:MAG: hypothetical protein LBK40_05680 [Spirochaetaceae bacterium]|nr:hypothetical protein [Spirochaetaceae bacterium]
MVLRLAYPSFAETTVYFDSLFIEAEITNQNHQSENVIFDRDRLQDCYIYKTRNFLHRTIREHYVEYRDYNIMLISEIINEIEYVRDFLIIKKRTPETTLADGAVQVNNGDFDWELTVVVNRRWRGSTDDISQAFKINFETKKIEPFSFITLRLYSEV